MSKKKKRKKAPKDYKHQKMKRKKKLPNLTANRVAPKIKLSEAILILSEPLRKQYSANHQIEVIITMTIIAWNISIFPEDKQEHVRKSLINEFPKKLSREDIALLFKYIDAMVERKKKYYPNINELIIDYNLSISSDTINLTVGTAPLTTKIQKKSS